ncbi:hypothetical protein NA57DRAFT_55969 [Rhizodiscina lignyota]|uniref:Uncharacterized protein n=1 Tax=Rhizodiscina lignyota TaxID=1504668 RepID=A0A9P4IHD7_9PEZI|nr:hypothetical protein NA57DRAFT_55969 [Rhizodiscina lignyota]
MASTMASELLGRNLERRAQLQELSRKLQEQIQQVEQLKPTILNPTEAEHGKIELQEENARLKLELKEQQEEILGLYRVIEKLREENTLLRKDYGKRVTIRAKNNLLKKQVKELERARLRHRRDHSSHSIDSRMTQSSRATPMAEEDSSSDDDHTT